MRHGLWTTLGLLALAIHAGCGGSSMYRESAAGAAAPMASPMEPASPPADAVMAGMPAKEDEMYSADKGSIGGEERMRLETSKTAQLQQPGRGAPTGGTTPPSGKTGKREGTEGNGPAKHVDGPEGAEGGGAARVQAPMLIYTADLTMAVFEVGASLSAIEQVAREVGGFLARRDDMSITIRVPSRSFDDAVKRVEKIGDMIHRNVSTEDVTEEFLDLEVRLKNARAIRERLEQLLAKATKVEESLLIERELGRVAGEIERIEGRMKYLRDRAAFSTITVRFQPRKTETDTPARVQVPVPWLSELGLGRLLNL